MCTVLYNIKQPTRKAVVMFRWFRQLWCASAALSRVTQTASVFAACAPSLTQRGTDLTGPDFRILFICR